MRLDVHRREAEAGPPPSAVRTGTLVVGLGSPHGDDRIGWLVAEEIARRTRDDVAVRCLTLPVDVCTEMQGFERVVIIDACRMSDPIGAARRWTWPAPEIRLLRASGTHAIGLPESLALAERIGGLPPEVVVWGVSARNFAPQSELAEALLSAVPDVADRILMQDICVPSSGGPVDA
ncbi:MAG: hydrogenase maturation protease [Planctomyces sp.]|nr:hydrogenase maturation protease [Planctomyces sp.]